MRLPLWTALLSSLVSLGWSENEAEMSVEAEVCYPDSSCPTSTISASYATILLDNSCGRAVKVGDGSLVSVDDSSLSVSCVGGSSGLHMGPRAALSLAARSKLSIKGGSRMTVESGGEVDVGGGSGVELATGSLTLLKRSGLTMDESNVLISHGGEVRLTGDVDLDHTSVQVSNRAQLLCADTFHRPKIAIQGSQIIAVGLDSSVFLQNGPIIMDQESEVEVGGGGKISIEDKLDMRNTKLKAINQARITLAGKSIVEHSVVSAENDARLVVRDQLELRESFLTIADRSTRVQIEKLTTGHGRSGLQFYSSDVELWDRLHVKDSSLKVSDSRMYGKAPFEISLTGPGTDMTMSRSAILLFPYTHVEIEPRSQFTMENSYLEIGRHGKLWLKAGVSTRSLTLKDPTGLTMQSSGIRLQDHAELHIGNGVQLSMHRANLTLAFRAHLHIRVSSTSTLGSVSIPPCLLGLGGFCDLSIGEGQRVYWHVPRTPTYNSPQSHFQ